MIYLVLILFVVIISSTCDSIPCGQKIDLNNDDARIIGGEDVQPNQYPWMVYMKLNYLPLHEWQKPMTSSCDGSIINDRWIISAAHCFAPNGYNLSENIVYLGSHNITKTEEKNRKIIKAKKVIYKNKQKSIDQLITKMNILIKIISIHIPGHNT